MTENPDDGHYDPALDDEECQTELGLAYDRIIALEKAMGKIAGMEERDSDSAANEMMKIARAALRGVVGNCEQATTDTMHYLNAIRHRLETLYALSANDPRLREQLSDEVDWIDAQIGL